VCLVGMPCGCWCISHAGGRLSHRPAGHGTRGGCFTAWCCRQDSRAGFAVGAAGTLGALGVVYAMHGAAVVTMRAYGYCWCFSIEVHTRCCALEALQEVGHGRAGYGLCHRCWPAEQRAPTLCVPRVKCGLFNGQRNIDWG
jgi:hypothetical protein